jgi:hypothetical protein
MGIMSEKKKKENKNKETGLHHHAMPIQPMQTPL